jgi:GDP-mannose transporter
MSRNSDEKKPFPDDNEIEMGEKQGSSYSPPRPTTPRYTPAAPPAATNPLYPILSYCGSSILMTVTNKYVLAGTGFNLNFLLLAVQVGELYLKTLDRS